MTEDKEVGVKGSSSVEGSEQQSGLQKPTVFARQATGLVKNLDLFDMFSYNVAGWSGPTLVATPLLLAALIGGLPIDWVLLSVALALPVVLTYYMVSVTMPRTGADYVFVSRILHPSLGFVLGAFAGIMAPLVFLAGFGALGWIPYGASPTLYYLGYLYHNAGLTALSQDISVPWVSDSLGVAVILIFALVMGVKGAKAVFRANAIIMTLGAVVVVGAVIFFLRTSSSDFTNAFNTMASGTTTYSGIISIAGAQGWTLPSTGIYAGLLASATMFTGFYAANQSSIVSGEIKSIKRTQPIAMVGAVAVWGCLMAALLVVMFNVVGGNFISASDFLTLFAPSSWPLSVGPYAPLFVSLAANNAFFSVLFSLAWIGAFFIAIPLGLVVISRYAFALSFDRILPSSISDVSPRFNTPLKAIAVAAIAGCFMTLLFVLPITSSQIILFTAGISLPYFVVYSFTSIAAIIFPYRNKVLFEGSPFKRRIAGVPLISIMGALSVACLMTNAAIYLTVPSYYGLNQTTLELWFGTLIALFALYFVVSSYRKSKGVPLDLVYKEVPPE